MNAILRQRNANRIPNSIRQQRPNPNRAFDPRVFAFARFGHAQMNRIIPIRPFLRQARHEQSVGIDHHFRIARFHREDERVIIEIARDPREFERALHHAERRVAVSIHDSIAERPVVCADAYGDPALLAKLDQRREALADPLQLGRVLLVAIFAN